MSPNPPALLDAAVAAKALEASIRSPKEPLTIADAAAASGLALRDAERGMHWLTSTYRGHLRVTNSGELLFLFPYGFTKPWETRDAIRRIAQSVGRAAMGALRFAVRAWLTIVLLTYVAVFVAILIAMTLARQNNESSRRNSSSGDLAGVLLRVVSDALFWTFHPFSPLRVDVFNDSQRYGRRVPTVPFYERVNRFFFGPTIPPEDPRTTEKRLLQHIRAEKGRIGLADVLRVTGLPREQADPMLARLMLDYEGEVEVSEEGGITYRFEAIRKSTAEQPPPMPEPVWAKPLTLPPLTGNDFGSNLMIAGLNGFNLIMGFYAIGADLTINRLSHLFDRFPTEIPYDGPAIVLGLIPFVFSIALFLLPVGRALYRPTQARSLAREKGRLALLRTILSRIASRSPVTDPVLTSAWKTAAGEAPTSSEITKQVVALGGDVDIQETGEIRYRFADLETEAVALQAQRDEASEEEVRVGNVIFASDEPGP